MVLCAVILSGCCSTQKESSTLYLPLINTRWEIISLKTEKVTNTNIFLSLKDKGKFTGNVGCNSIGGNYAITEGAIKFSETISTKMACKDLDIENKFLKALSESNFYKISEDTLMLYSGNEPLLKFIGK